jgi:hypothetical protein
MFRKISAKWHIKLFTNYCPRIALRVKWGGYPIVRMGGKFHFLTHATYHKLSSTFSVRSRR